MIQDSLIQPEANVAAPIQEISTAANSDAATEALASHTLSIFVDYNDDDDDATEVTSTSAILVSISDPVRDTTPARVDSPVQALSPVRESSPLRTPTPIPSSPLLPSMPAKRKVCHLTYFQRMCRATPPSVDDRLASIEATQKSMQHTLADLSSSIALLVQALTSDNVKKGEKVLKDKCKDDQPLMKKKPDDDEEGNKEATATDENFNKQLVQIRERSNKDANSERPRESN